MKAKRLSFRTLAKLSFRGFFDRPVRLVFTVFLSLVSFVLMGTSVTLARYTPEKAMIETYASEVQSFRLTPMAQKPSRAEADALLPLAFGAVTSGAFLDASALVPDDGLLDRAISFQRETGLHVQSAVNAAAYLPPKVREALSLSWCAGGMPQKEGEAALSSCAANAYLAAGSAKGYAEVVGRKLNYTLPDGTQREAVIVGVYDTSDCSMGGDVFTACTQDTGNWKGALLLPENVFWEIAEDAGGADALWYAGDGSRTTGEVLLAFLNTHGEYSSGVFDVVAVYHEKIGMVQTWCVSLGAALTAFSALLLYQLISVLLDDNLEMLGVLRMLGARGSVCVQIAMTGSIALGLFAGVLGAALSLAGNVLVNVIFRTVLRVPIAVAGFDLVAFLSVIALGLAVGALAAVVPSVRLARRSPIQMQPQKRA